LGREWNQEQDEEPEEQKEVVPPTAALAQDPAAASWSGAGEVGWPNAAAKASLFVYT